MDSKWTKAVLEECEKARKELRPISHSCARTLANMYSQGMDEAQKFASSGAILPGLLDKLFPKVRFDSALMFDEKEFLLHRDSVRNYIKGREKAGTCFPGAGVKNWNEIYIGGVELSDPLLPCESVQDMLARINHEEAVKRYQTLKKKEGIPPSIRRQIDGRMFADLHVICENDEENFFHVRGSLGRHDQDTFLVSVGSWCPENFLVHGCGCEAAIEVCLDKCRELGYKGLVSADPLDVTDRETVNEMMNDEEGSGDWNERLQMDSAGNYYDPQELHYYEINAKKDPYFTVIKADRCTCEICCGEALEEPELERFWSLREALKAFWEYDISDEQGPVESSSFPWNPGDSCRRTGRQWDMTPNWCDEESACREVSFHLENVTASSQKRIMRLIGVYGMGK